MNSFEQELRKLFADGRIIDNPTFSGRACFGDIGQDLRVKIEFATHGTIDHYSSLQATVINRKDGVVDRLKIHFRDILGMKRVPGNPNFPHGVSPHIWVNGDKTEWYAFKPSSEDYKTIQNSVRDYVSVFMTKEERSQKASLDAQIKGAYSRTVEDISTATGKDKSFEL